jgi:sugar phosphate isomerase/epimerase
MAKKRHRNTGSKDRLPKFGFMASPIKNIFSEIRKAKELGADYVEITLETLNHPANIMGKSQRIVRALERNGLFCNIHFAYWADFGSEYDAVREGWLKECVDAMVAAHSIGARKFLVHARPQSGMSMTVNARRKAIISGMASSFWLLAKVAKRKGMRLVIENEDIGRGKPMSIIDMERISRRIPKSGIALDAAHVFLGNSNRTIKAFIRGLGPRIEHCHFSDNHGEFDEHLSIGRGRIDYDMVVRELKRIGYGMNSDGTNDGTITLEIFRGGERAFKSSMKKIKGMWRSG